MSGLLEIAARLEAGKLERDTLRFSECIVPGKKVQHEWGAVISTSPKLMRLFCDIWNHRKEVASAIRASQAAAQ